MRTRPHDGRRLEVNEFSGDLVAGTTNTSDPVRSRWNLGKWLWDARKRNIGIPRQVQSINDPNTGRLFVCVGPKAKPSIVNDQR